MLLKEFQNKINFLLSDICWAHWRRLGAYASGPVSRCSTDPEALIILTCLAGKQDLRLFEIMQQWVVAYHHLIPIDRMKGICEKIFDETDLRKYMNIFSEMLKISLTASELKRWKIFLARTHINTKNPPYLKAHFKKVESLKKIEKNSDILAKNQQLQLRYIFGPGSRADIYYLCHILSFHENNHRAHKISASTLAQWLCYDRSSIHRILDDFENGNLLKKTEASKHGNFLDYQVSENQKLFAPTLNKKEFFIDWLQIIRMSLQWISFEDWLSNSKIPLHEDSKILKTYLYNICKDIPRFAQLTYIPKDFLIFSDQSIEKIPLKEILNWIYKSFKLSYDFIKN